MDEPTASFLGIQKTYPPVISTMLRRLFKDIIIPVLLTLSIGICVNILTGSTMAWPARLIANLPQVIKGHPLRFFGAVVILCSLIEAALVLRLGHNFVRWAARHYEKAGVHARPTVVRVWDDCPAVTGLFGRRTKLTQMRRLLRRGSQIVILEGHSGIGKSSLAALALRKMESRFDVVCWHCFRYNASVEALVDTVLNVVDEKTSTDLHDKISRLAQKLHRRRCIFVFDGAEHIRASNSPILGQLIRQLSAVRGLCVLITTTEVFPNSLLVGTPFEITRIQLKGLSRPDIAKLAKSIMPGHSLSIAEGELLESRLNGNPQLIRLVLDDAQRRFAGDVKRAIEVATKDAVSTVDTPLDHQMSLLSTDERNALFAICLWGKPFTAADYEQWITKAFNYSEIPSFRGLTEKPLFFQ